MANPLGESTVPVFRHECPVCKLHHHYADENCVQELSRRVRELEDEVYNLSQWKIHSKSNKGK